MVDIVVLTFTPVCLHYIYIGVVPIGFISEAAVIVVLSLVLTIIIAIACMLFYEEKSM